MRYSRFARSTAASEPGTLLHGPRPRHEHANQTRWLSTLGSRPESTRSLAPAYSDGSTNGSHFLRSTSG